MHGMSRAGAGGAGRGGGSERDGKFVLRSRAGGGGCGLEGRGLWAGSALGGATGGRCWLGAWSKAGPGLRSL